MKPSTLASVLPVAWQSRARPILIVGAPGIGKSDIVAQAADTLGAPLFISHPAVEDPTDVKGFPFPSPDGSHATFLPFGVPRQVLAASETSETVVWFIDDLGQASEAVQKAYMQLLLARQLGELRLPDNVVFVAATNDRTHRAGVGGILEPVKSRFGAIIHLQPDLADWTKWACVNNIPPQLLAFLRQHPDLLSAFEPTADLRNSPSPRTWHAFARTLQADYPADARVELLSGAVGEGAAAQYLAFEAMYDQIPAIDAILLDPDGAPIPDTMAVLSCVATGLAFRATDINFARVARYATRLYDAAYGDYAAMLVRDAVRRTPPLVSHPAFVRLATHDGLGSLLLGD